MAVRAEDRRVDAALRQIAAERLAEQDAAEAAQRERAEAEAEALRLAAERAVQLSETAADLRAALGHCEGEFKRWLDAFRALMASHAAYRAAGGSISRDTLTMAIGRALGSGVAAIIRSNALGRVQLNPYGSGDHLVSWPDKIFPTEQKDDDEYD